MSFEATAQCIVAIDLRAALTSNSEHVKVKIGKCNLAAKVKSESAISLLEVESACHHRLRYGIWRMAKPAWLFVIGIALSTPREAH